MSKALSNTIQYCIKKIFSRFSKEAKIIKKSIVTNNHTELLRYVETISGKFIPCGMNWISPGGCIEICDDLYGYEVSINGGPLIDSDYEWYGWTRGTGIKIYKAIVDCIPNLEEEKISSYFY